MTTDQDLRDLLTAEADGPAHLPAAWDDIVRRGHHHRRAARVRSSVAIGGLAAVVAVGGLVVADQQRNDRGGVVAEQPDGTFVAPTPDLQVATVRGALVTVILDAAQPDEGFDPCTDQAAAFTETDAEVTITILANVSDQSGMPWAACGSTPNISWGTLELTDPLGDRAVVDASDGMELTVINGRPILFPTWLPDEFDLDRWDANVGEVNDVEGWVFHFQAGSASLSVSSNYADPGPGCPVKLDIRNGRGTACYGHNQINLRWDEDGTWDQIDLHTGGADLTIDDVVRIAEGLEPLGG